jgi:hypothetical protein
LALYAITTDLMERTGPGQPDDPFRQGQGFSAGMALATGILMVVKNLPGVHFPMAMLMVFNFTHMASAMLFMVAAWSPLFSDGPGDGSAERPIPPDSYILVARELEIEDFGWIPANAATPSCDRTCPCFFSISQLQLPIFFCRR